MKRAREKATSKGVVVVLEVSPVLSRPEIVGRWDGCLGPEDDKID